jgi:hypothetical protein
MCAIQFHIKTASNTLGVMKRTVDIPEGRARKTSVGVKKEQDIAGGLPRSVIHLQSTTSRRRKHRCAEAVADFGCPV